MMQCAISTSLVSLATFPGNLTLSLQVSFWFFNILFRLTLRHVSRIHDYRLPLVLSIDKRGIGS